MKTEKPTLSRRHFLLGAGAATVAGVATVTRTQTGGETSIPNSALPGNGYRLTEHVRNYYRTARL